MTSLIKSFIALFFIYSSLHSQEVTYNIKNMYVISSNINLINDISYKDNKTYKALIEIPTGTRQKWEVNHNGKYIEWEFKNNKPRVVNFLGYPGNYGYIPQTRSGDGDPLDVIVLSQSVKRGDIINIKVIGMLKLEDTGEEDTKIIAIADTGAFKEINSLSEMLLKYPSAINIVKEWFESYKGVGFMLFKGYADKDEAIQHIETAHQKWINKKF